MRSTGGQGWTHRAWAKQEAERNAADKTFRAFAVLQRAESRWFALHGKPRSSHATSPVFHAAAITHRRSAPHVISITVTRPLLLVWLGIQQSQSPGGVIAQRRLPGVRGMFHDHQIYCE